MSQGADRTDAELTAVGLERLPDSDDAPLYFDRRNQVEHTLTPAEAQHLARGRVPSPTIYEVLEASRNNPDNRPHEPAAEGMWVWWRTGPHPEGVWQAMDVSDPGWASAFQNNRLDHPVFQDAAHGSRGDWGDFSCHACDYVSDGYPEPDHKTRCDGICKRRSCVDHPQRPSGQEAGRVLAWRKTCSGCAGQGCDRCDMAGTLPAAEGEAGAFRRVVREVPVPSHGKPPAEVELPGRVPTERVADIREQVRSRPHLAGECIDARVELMLEVERLTAERDEAQQRLAEEIERGERSHDAMQQAVLELQAEAGTLRERLAGKARLYELAADGYAKLEREVERLTAEVAALRQSKRGLGLVAELRDEVARLGQALEAVRAYARAHPDRIETDDLLAVLDGTVCRVCQGIGLVWPKGVGDQPHPCDACAGSGRT